MTVARPHTPEQKLYLDQAMGEIKRIADLLSPVERDDLYRDLAEMARLRRKAEAESANIVIGSEL